MTDIELMKQALEKLEFLAHMKSVSEDTRRLITALQERLARQEQKPVAWRAHVEQRLLTWRQAFANRSGRSCVFSLLDRRSLDDLIDFVCDEYTAPREWQGLTHFDRALLRTTHARLKELCYDKEADCSVCETVVTDWEAFFTDIEAMLKEKNT